MTAQCRPDFLIGLRDDDIVIGTAHTLNDDNRRQTNNIISIVPTAVVD